jgi:hypothetical protein
MSATTRVTSIWPSRHDDGPIVMRTAGPGDEGPLERLAQLDSHSPLEGPVLMAEVAGQLRAARSLRSGETIADPFNHTAHLRGLLATRSAQISPARERRRRFAIRFLRLYARAEAR